jgi:hypothetical protein
MGTSGGDGQRQLQRHGKRAGFLYLTSNAAGEQLAFGDNQSKAE